MNDSDDNLMIRFGQGDAAAFEALFARYHRLVYNYAYMNLRDRAAAQDILQDTFIAAAKGVTRYEERGQFRSWLMGICRHRVLALLERRNVRDRLMQTSGLELVTPANEAPPWVPLERKEQLEATLTALSALPPVQRDALSLYALNEFGYGEIAAILDCPVNTVKTLIRRGRLRLAAVLSAGNGGES